MRKFVTTRIRDCIAEYLRANLEIVETGAEIVTRERAKLPSQIAEIIAGIKLGIIVMPAVAIKANANTDPLYVETLQVTIRVVETVLNDTEYEAEEIAELLHTYLHGWKLPPTIDGEPLLFSEPNDPMMPGSVGDNYYVDCIFNTHGGVPFKR
ncbi:MAG: hypothetical protein LBV12_07060 [Puniceicoccales bacterium]|jgi:hypothetical protein|nr:hypothetical protein [Puniceicoccales bacterium]